MSLCENCDASPCTYRCCQCGVSVGCELLCDTCELQLHATAKGKTHTPTRIAGATTNKQAVNTSTPSNNDDHDILFVNSYPICSNCDDAPSTVRCVTCSSDYCTECDGDFHRPAKQQGHTKKTLCLKVETPQNNAPPPAAAAAAAARPSTANSAAGTVSALAAIMRPSTAAPSTTANKTTPTHQTSNSISFTTPLNLASRPTWAPAPVATGPRLTSTHAYYQSLPMCELCEAEQAQYYCQDESESWCDSCWHDVHSSTLKRSHTQLVVSLEPPPTPSPPPPSKPTLNINTQLETKPTVTPSTPAFNPLLSPAAKPVELPPSLTVPKLDVEPTPSPEPVNITPAITPLHQTETNNPASKTPIISPRSFSRPPLISTDLPVYAASIPSHKSTHLSPIPAGEETDTSRRNSWTPHDNQHAEKHEQTKSSDEWERPVTSSYPAIDSKPTTSSSIRPSSSSISYGSASSSFPSPLPSSIGNTSDEENLTNTHKISTQSNVDILSLDFDDFKVDDSEYKIEPLPDDDGLDSLLRVNIDKKDKPESHESVPQSQPSPQSSHHSIPDPPHTARQLSGGALTSLSGKHLLLPKADEIPSHRSFTPFDSPSHQYETPIQIHRHIQPPSPHVASSAPTPRETPLELQPSPLHTSLQAAQLAKQEKQQQYEKEQAKLPEKSHEPSSEQQPRSIDPSFHSPPPTHASIDHHHHRHHSYDHESIHSPDEPTLSSDQEQTAPVQHQSNSRHQRKASHSSSHHSHRSSTHASHTSHRSSNSQHRRGHSVELSRRDSSDAPPRSSSVTRQHSAGSNTIDRDVHSIGDIISALFGDSRSARDLASTLMSALKHRDEAPGAQADALMHIARLAKEAAIEASPPPAPQPHTHESHRPSRQDAWRNSFHDSESDALPTARPHTANQEMSSPRSRSHHSMQPRAPHTARSHSRSHRHRHREHEHAHSRTHRQRSYRHEIDGDDRHEYDSSSINEHDDHLSHAHTHRVQRAPSRDSAYDQDYAHDSLRSPRSAHRVHAHSPSINYDANSYEPDIDDDLVHRDPQLWLERKLRQHQLRKQSGGSDHVNYTPPMSPVHRFQSYPYLNVATPPFPRSQSAYNGSPVAAQPYPPIQYLSPSGTYAPHPSPVSMLPPPHSYASPSHTSFYHASLVASYSPPPPPLLSRPSTAGPLPPPSFPSPPPPLTRPSTAAVIPSPPMFPSPPPLSPTINNHPHAHALVNQQRSYSHAFQTAHSPAPPSAASPYRYRAPPPMQHMPSLPLPPAIQVSHSPLSPMSPPHPAHAPALTHAHSIAHTHHHPPYRYSPARP